MHSNLCNGMYIHLEESTQESESLKSKIKELEKQLSMEKEECKRLGEQLGLDARAASIEDDIGIDMLSYEENLGKLLVSHQNDKASPMKDQYKSSPNKKMMRSDMVEADEKSKQGNMRPERHSRGNPCIAQTQNCDKVISNTRHLANVDMVEADDKSKPGRWPDCFQVVLMVMSKDIEAAIHRQAPSLLNLATVLFPNFSIQDIDGGRLYVVIWRCGIFNLSTLKISHCRYFATDSGNYAFFPFLPKEMYDQMDEAYPELMLSDRAYIVDRFSSKRFKISSTFLNKREHLDVLQKRQMLVGHIEHGETTERGKSKTPRLSHPRLEAIDKCSVNFFWRRIE
ncbi:hypothetical protein Tco_1337532 [Tanacetum coccineum]